MCVYLDDPHWGPCGYCLLDRRKKTMTVISSRRRIKGRNGIRESLGEAPSFPIHQRPTSRAKRVCLSFSYSLAMKWEAVSTLCVCVCERGEKKSIRSAGDGRKTPAYAIKAN